MVTLAVWGVLLPLAVTWILVGDVTGWLLLAAALPWLAPWTTARLVAVPLGSPRLAYAFARVAEVACERDRIGGALLAAAWATLRRPTTAKVVWVEQRLAAAQPLGGAGMVAGGLLAAATGDDAGARLLLAATTLVAADDMPPVAARLAAEWLAAEAAERGDWASVRVPLLRTRTTRLLATAASRLLGDAVPRQALWTAWVLAGRWRQTWGLLRIGLERPGEGGGAGPLPERARTAGAVYRDGASALVLEAALERHVRLCAAETVSGGDLLATAAAWDAVLADVPTRLLVEERARAVGARAPDALARLSAGVTEDLAEVAWASGKGFPESRDGVAAAAAARLRERVLRDVEQAARALASRVGAGRALPAVHEWREVLSLREHVARAGRLGGLGTRRLVFEDVHGAVCPLACRLWNDRDQRPLANALFRWLLSEAEAVGNARLAEHERRNIGPR